MANATAEQLNAILAHIWSLVRLLRKLESRTEHPGTKEALKRVRMDCSAHCASLSGLIRNFGTGPVDKPGELARKIESMDDERELWELLDAGLDEGCTQIQSTISGLGEESHRKELTSVEHNLRENRQWLQRLAPRS